MTVPDHIREYLIATHQTHTVRQQSSELGCSYEAIRYHRGKLRHAGIISSRRSPAWTDEEWFCVQELTQAGYSVPQIAKRIGRSVGSVQAAIFTRGEHLSTLRNAPLATVRSLKDVSVLFGVHHCRVMRWVRRGWLYARRNGVRTRRRSRRYAECLVTDQALEKFIGCRLAWPSWDPAHIIDPDWRAAAIEVRAQAGGRWISTPEAGRLLGYSRPAVIGWIRAGNWNVELTQYGRQYFIWLTDGAALDPPPAGARWHKKEKDQCQTTSATNSPS